MSAATSSRSSAIWSRSASAWCARRSAARCRRSAHLQAEERVLDALVGEHASPTTRDSFRKRLRAGELDDKEIEIQVKDTSNPMGSFEVPGMPGASIGVMNVGEMLGKALGQGRTKTRKVNVKDSYELLLDEEADKLLDQDAGRDGGDPRGGGRRHRLPRRDRQDRGAERHRTAAPFARRRAARSAAARRRHDRRHEVRAGEDGPHPLHRVGRLPRVEAVGPAAGAAGPPADPRRAPRADRGGFPPHPDGDGGEPHQAVQGADGDRGRDARVHATTRSTRSPASRSR